MNFYFYTNKNIMFDFLGRNVIATDPIVKDIKRYRTLGTASDYFLFVTHKKLDRVSREKGIDQPEFVYPITLQLSEVTEQDGKAILVKRTESGIEYSLDLLMNYNSETHIGAYLFGEIPLSRVQKIYFDTQDEMDMFSRPSPDYWYPANKYEILPEDFTDTFTLELYEERLLAAGGIDEESVIQGFRTREKRRAGILNFVNGTSKWQNDRYVFSIDGSLQQYFALTDDVLQNILPHYLENRDKGIVEYITLCGESVKSTEFNQKIYDIIVDVLIQQPYNTLKQPEEVVLWLNEIGEKIAEECNSSQEKQAVKDAIVEIEKLITDASDKGPEEIMASILEPIDVLKALMFVAKNPNRYEVFLESLEAYHADQLTKRRAMVLWGLLNGLYGMPGDGFNKDNQVLWQYIEASVADEDKTLSVHVEKPDVVIEKNKVLGIQIKEERIVTSSEIRSAILAMPKENLKDAFYRKLLEAAEVEFGTKKKAENRGYAHCVASILLPEIKPGDELNPKVRKMLEQLVKDCKSAVPNKEKLYKDYIETEGKFDFVFGLDPDYWKRSIKAVQER